MQLPITVIGRRPDGENSLIEVPLVSLHDELMGATDQVDVIGMVKLAHHIRSEEEAGTAWTDAPALRVLWIRPQQITHWTVVGHFLLLNKKI